MLSSTTAAGRVAVITAGRYGSSTSSTPTPAFGSAASAAVSPAGMFAPPSLLTTAPRVRRAAVSRVRVVLFPFVPLTRINRRPAAARRSANGSTASMTRPPMVVPPPEPVSLDRAAAAEPSPRATANRVPPGGIAVAPYLSLTRVQHFGTIEPWPKAPPSDRLTRSSRSVRPLIMGRPSPSRAGHGLQADYQSASTADSSRRLPRFPSVTKPSLSPQRGHAMTPPD